MDQKGVLRGYTKLSYRLIRGYNSFAWGAKVNLHIILDYNNLLMDVVHESVNSHRPLGLKRSDLKKLTFVMVYFLSKNGGVGGGGGLQQIC
jgi:hypothetical protein